MPFDPTTGRDPLDPTMWNQEVGKNPTPTPASVFRIDEREMMDALRRAKHHYYDLYDDASAEGDHVGATRDLYRVAEALETLYCRLVGMGWDG